MSGGLRIYHTAKSEPYHRGNSIRGIRRAKRRGYNATDIDLNISKDDQLVPTHWGRLVRFDGFKDPLNQLGKSAVVKRLTFDQIARLRTDDGYRVLRLEALLRECARLGIVAVVEAKNDPRFERDYIWQQLRRLADKTGADVRVRSIKDLGGKNAGGRRVKAAQRNGFQAWTI